MLSVFLGKNIYIYIFGNLLILFSHIKGFQTSNHCYCSPLVVFQPVLRLSWRPKHRAKYSIWSLTIAEQSGGITSYVLDREFCLYVFLFIAACLCLFMFSMCATLIHILFSTQILVSRLFCLLEQNILLTSSVKWHENNVVWVYSKEREAPFKIPSPASQDFSKCFKTVLVELFLSRNNNEVSLSKPSYILFICCNNRAFKEGNTNVLSKY